MNATLSTRAIVPRWLADSIEWTNELPELSNRIKAGRVKAVDFTSFSIRYATARYFQRLARALNDSTYNLDWVEIAVLQGKLTDQQAGRIVALAIECGTNREAAFPVGVVGHKDAKKRTRENLAGSGFIEYGDRIYCIHAAGRYIGTGEVRVGDVQAIADANLARMELGGRAIRLLTIEELS